MGCIKRGYRVTESGNHLLNALKFGPHDMASRGTLKHVCSSCPDIHRPQQSLQPLPLHHCLAPWCGQECRNVAPSQAGGDYSRAGGFQLSPCLPILFDTLCHLQCMLLHAAHSCCSPSHICSSHTSSLGGQVGHRGPARMWPVKGQMWGRS